MDVHADEGRPHMTRSEINGPQTSECRPACRLDRGDPVIVDEAVDKRRAVVIESRLRPVGQKADRNAGSQLRLIDNGYRMTQCSGGVRQGR
jgi:hypothetical protein